MTDTVYVVMRAEHYDQNYPIAVCRTEEEVDEFIEEEAEKYEFETDSYGGEYYVYDCGMFTFDVKETPMITNGDAE